MYKTLVILLGLLVSTNLFSTENDTITYELDEVSVVSFYRNNVSNSNVLSKDYLLKNNKGQEPSFIFNTLPIDVR